jgi:hypothetical protein
MITENMLWDALQSNGVKVELGAQYSVRGQFAQVFNAVKELTQKDGAARDALRALMPFVLDDYMPDFATPACKAAVEAAQEAAQ